MSNLDAQSQNAKKSYHAPKLDIYGNIRTMTLAIMDGNGLQDNPTMTNRKSQPA